MSDLRQKMFLVFLAVLLFDVVVVQSIDPNVGINPVQAQSVPNICIDPPETVDSLLVVGQEFTVSINISNLEDPDYGLYAWQAKIVFNLDVVNCTAKSKIAQGPFLPDWFGETEITSLSKYIDYNTGYVFLQCGKTPPYEGGGAIGDGILAYITFTVVANGRATLLQFDIGEEGGTYLRTAVEGQSAPLEPFTTDDGVFDNRSPGSNAAPVASFSLLPTVPGQRGKVWFDCSASYDPDAWITSCEWNYGDGTSEIYLRERLTNINLTTTPTHVYANNGTYPVTLTVEDCDGVTATTSSDVTVLFDIAVTNVESPFIAVMPGIIVTINVTVANYGDFNENFNLTTYYDETAIETQEDLFLAPQTEGIFTFNWNTTYVDLGQYTLKANASVVEGEVNVANNEYIDGFVTVAESNLVNYPVFVGGVKFIVVVESTSSISTFRFTRVEKRIGFNVTGELDTGGFCNVTIPMNLLNASSPDAWIVDLDDAPISYTAISNGTHYFIYFDYTHGNVPSTIKIIGETVATPPVALFTASKTTAEAGESITFNASASHDPDGTIESWNWNFGDSNTDTGEIVEHSFTTPGTYIVTLTVKDDEQLANSTQQTIQVVVLVHDIAIVSLTASPTTVKIGEIVTIQTTVENNGNFTESFTIMVYANDTEIETKSVTDLASGESELLTVLWDTASFSPAAYIIKAETSIIPEETETDDNTYIDDTVIVQKRTSALTIDSSLKTFTVGETTTITGTLTPILQGATITVQYRLAGGYLWQPLDTTTTNAQGQYELTWTPDQSGTYEMQATWQGDVNTEASQSSIQTVTVNQAMGNLQYIAIGVALVIIIVVAIAIYFFRIRR